MSVIQYQCDTCNRIIDIPQNKNGLEVMQNCIITDGCHGKLSQINIKLDHIRGNFPSKIDNLDDYIQRKILYNHKQSIKLIEWNIIHNLGIAPFIQVFIERPKVIDNIENINLENEESFVELVEIEPEYIKIISINEILVGFSRPEKGIAQLIAKSSNKQQIISTLVDTNITYTQLSNTSDVTIATLNDSNDITLDIMFYLPDGSTSSISYNVDNNPSINSPWVNYNQIYNGKTYTVRSFNLFDEDFSSIDTGSSFSIETINGLQVNKNDLLFLLAKYPYTTNDKIVDKYLDIYDIAGTNSLNNTLYNNGELLINDEKITKIYPYIKKV